MENEWITEADDQLQSISLDDNSLRNKSIDVPSASSILSSPSAEISGFATEAEVAVLGEGEEEGREGVEEVGGFTSDNNSSINLTGIGSPPPPIIPASSSTPPSTSTSTESTLDKNESDTSPNKKDDNVVTSKADDINQVIEKEKTIELVFFSLYLLSFMYFLIILLVMYL